MNGAQDLIQQFGTYILGGFLALAAGIAFYKGSWGKGTLAILGIITVITLTRLDSATIDNLALVGNNMLTFLANKVSS